MNFLKSKLYSYILIFFLIFQVSASTLNPFDTDGCSMVPDGTPRNPQMWKQCCLWHDIAYWKGGTRKDRRTADKNFNLCLKEFGPNFIGFIYYYGVRVGGHPSARLPFSWGYGWESYRGYRELNQQELEQVQKLTPLIDQ
ncbi:FAD-binding oxidoreductase [Halobacteriovorax sp. HLS]|uniref:FAD-binding oxidoreductase n=1 Tax=Halobacteriovorax sp. HLS TaxID=2234000 RepID=UPI000FD8A710|nr:FAD-binding oxidoreductase [Halobacteriovorax sp. HLS]